MQSEYDFNQPDVFVKYGPVGGSGTEYTAATVTFVSTVAIEATTPQDFGIGDEPLDIKINIANIQKSHSNRIYVEQNG